jgi:hypothetical protein
MRSRHWNWLLLVICAAGTACSQRRGNQCVTSARECQTAGNYQVATVDSDRAEVTSADKSDAILQPKSGLILPPDYVPNQPATATPATPPPTKSIIQRMPMPRPPVDAAPPPQQSEPVVEPGQPFMVTVPPVERPAEPRPEAAPAPAPAPLPKEMAKELQGSPTCASRYDHAGDFSFVVGEIQFLHGRNRWRLRYLSHEADDIYGGVVTLRGVEHLIGNIKSGQTVRIQGQLVDPDTAKAAPEYQVYEIWIVE